MSEELEGKSANGEIKELLQILAKPHVKVSLALVLYFSLYSSCTQKRLMNYKVISSLWTTTVLP